MEYWSIKDSADKVGKSESSIKRLVAEIKKNNPKKYSNPDYFKFEELKTGRAKIFLSRLLLEESYNVSLNNSSNHSMNGSNEPVNDFYIKTIEVLQMELMEKNKQIESLLERQRETNILLLDAKQKLQLSGGNKRRWFFFKSK